MSDSVDSTNPGGAAGDITPTKPPLRVSCSHFDHTSMIQLSDTDILSLDPRCDQWCDYP